MYKFHNSYFVFFVICVSFVIWGFLFIFYIFCIFRIICIFLYIFTNQHIDKRTNAVWKSITKLSKSQIRKGCKHLHRIAKENSKPGAKNLQNCIPKSIKQIMLFRNPDRLWRSAVRTKTPRGYRPKIRIEDRCISKLTILFI